MLFKTRSAMVTTMNFESRRAVNCQLVWRLSGSRFSSAQCSIVNSRNNVSINY